MHLAHGVYENRERKGECMEQLEQVKNMAAVLCGETKGAVSGYFEQPLMRTRRQLLTTGLLLFLAGVVIGFVFSPIKKGITVCSNNVDSFSSNEANDNNQASAGSREKRKRSRFHG